jgi:hypothetical protein
MKVLFHYAFSFHILENSFHNKLILMKERILKTTYS